MFSGYKNSFKNILLCFLLISSFLLAKQIWYSEKLWSYDYNFFINITKNVQNKLFPKEISVERLFYPYSIVVNKGNLRTVYYYNEEPYIYILGNVKNCLKEIKNHTETTVGEDEFLDVIKSRSIYINLGLNLNNKVAERFFSFSGFSKVNGIQYILISPSDMATNDIIIYIKDNKNSIWKFTGSYHEKSELNKIIDSYVSEESERYAFSFELFSTERKDGVSFDSNVLIPLSSVKKETIGIKTSLSNVTDILEIFNYNLNSSRMYITPDNARVYVSNLSTLKVYPYFMIEYTAADEGIDISGDGTSIDWVMELIQNIARVNYFAFDNLKLTHISNENPQTIRLDYYHRGGLIDFGESAIEIVLDNNRVLKYRQYFIDINPQEEIRYENTFIKALDKIYDENEIKGGETVSNAFTSYRFYGENGNFYPNWSIKISDKVFAVPY